MPRLVGGGLGVKIGQGGPADLLPNRTPHPALALGRSSARQFNFPGGVMANANQIPLYTKVGFRATIILLLLIGFMIVRNCAGAVASRATDAQQQKDFYAQGFAVGEKQGQGEEVAVQKKFANPLLKKVYFKGFRAGWDAKHPGSAPPPSE